MTTLATPHNREKKEKSRRKYLKSLIDVCEVVVISARVLEELLQSKVNSVLSTNEIDEIP